MYFSAKKRYRLMWHQEKLMIGACQGHSGAIDTVGGKPG